MKYDGIRCPVCKRVFDASSDVVVCPECGTPHHRECWFENGECINAQKHGTGFVWVNPEHEKGKEKKEKDHPKKDGKTDEKAAAAEADQSPEKKKADEYWKGEETQEPAEKPVSELPVIPAVFGKKGGESENGVIGEMKIEPDGTPHPEFREVRGEEKIGKYTVADYAAVIGQNVPKFIPKFIMMDKTGRRVSWNWAAFVFGPFYLAYRKLYKPALLALLCMFFLPLVFLNEVTDYYKTTYSVYENAMTQQAYDNSEELSKASEELSKSLPEPPFALSASSYVEFFVDILCGLYANYLCKRHCEKVLDKAKEKELTGNLREEFLKKKGGRSVLSIVLVVLVFYGFSLVLGTIYAAAGSDLGTLLRQLVK